MGRPLNLTSFYSRAGIAGFDILSVTRFLQHNFQLTPRLCQLHCSQGPWCGFVILANYSVSVEQPENQNTDEHY